MKKDIYTPCATCPFLVENHGKKTASGWYRIANIKRLWNGLRTGKAPGMICHSTDPQSPEYGGTKAVKPGHERECVAANTLVQRELTLLGAASSFEDYRQQRPQGLTKPGARMWAIRAMYQGTPFGGKVICGDVADSRIQIPSVKIQ